MKIIGAVAKYEVVNRTETVVFDEVHPCVSLKDKAIRTEFRGVTQVVEPGIQIMCPKEYIEWALNDPMSPFARDKTFYVEYSDNNIDIEAVRKERESTAKKAVEENKLPDGTPTEEWRPKQLMELYRALEPKTLPENSFIVMSPKGKARALREYMTKNNVVLKDGKVIKETCAA